MNSMMIGNGQETRDVIDEHLFVEALALTAFEINYRDPQPQDAEKVSAT